MANLSYNPQKLKRDALSYRARALKTGDIGHILDAEFFEEVYVIVTGDLLPMPGKQEAPAGVGEPCLSLVNSDATSSTTPSS